MLQMLFRLLLICVTVSSVESSRPNIVIIVADDLGFNDVSFHGSDQIPTPNLDALAYDGVMLNNYYVLPICTPSRSALMTGRYPIHTGLQHYVIASSEPYGLGLNETIFPQYLKEMDYKTHIVGKWHLGFYAKELTPTWRGFDTFFGYLGGKEDYWDHTNQEGTSPHMKDTWGLDLYDNVGEKLKVVKDKFGVYSTGMFTDRAVGIIHNHDKAQPLFLYLPYQAIHSGNGITPLEAPYDYLQRFQHIQHKGRRTTAAMVSALDDAIGRVVQSLNDTGLLDNTIILFSSDNGGPTDGMDSSYANNFPLRGMKHILWEGGLRASGFLWSPLLAKSPRQSMQMMHITDWLPSMLSAAGYDMTKLANRSLDGINQWQELSQDLPAKRTEILHNIDPKSSPEMYALRKGDYKLLFGSERWSGWYAPEGDSSGEENDILQDENPSYPFPKCEDSVVGNILSLMGRGKHLHLSKPFRVKCGNKPTNASTNCRNNKKPCLYNVKDDPCEYHNIADEHPDNVSNLERRISFYRSGMVPPKNVPLDPEGLPGRHGGIWGPWRDVLPQDEL